MDVKPGIKTTEFWKSALVEIALAIVGILAARGMVTDQEVSLIVELVRALTVLVVPLAMAWVNTQYTQSRTRIKEATIKE